MPIEVDTTFINPGKGLDCMMAVAAQAQLDTTHDPADKGLLACLESQAPQGAPEFGLVHHDLRRRYTLEGCEDLRRRCTLEGR